MPVSVPTFIKQAWAAVGTKFTIPDNANPTTGRAGWDQGFSPINLTPVAAGGIPPFGQDMNGVLYDLSQAIQYVQSGVAFQFNQDFATSIGGYEIGAIVSDPSNKSLLWINGVALNTSFPTGWTSFSYGDPTEALRGMPFVATPAEASALTNNDKMLTPEGLGAAFSGNGSIAASGYQKLPGGLILQWGVVNSNSSGVGSFTFPISFPNACLSVQLTDQGGSVATADVWACGSLGQTSVTCYSANNSGSSTSTAAYLFAIGY